MPKTNSKVKKAPVNVDFIIGLYKKYAAELAVVRDAQRAFAENMVGRMTPQLDDLEAEITYLLLREYRPERVVEIGTFHGWSTSWLLSALRDNGMGHLYSYDIIDNVARNVPAELAKGRWTFTQGDIRQQLEALPENIDYLFIDAAHNGWFARWYVANLLPRVAKDTPTSVHDVFHGRFVFPFTEGAVVLAWLRRTGTNYFTASAAKAPNVYQKLLDARKELGLEIPVRIGHDNPMIFFRLPG